MPTRRELFGTHRSQPWEVVGIAPGNRNIELVSAWRLQHRQLWESYCNAKGRVADDFMLGPPLDQLPYNRKQVQLRTALEQFNSVPATSVDATVNEMFLIHGPPANSLEQCLNEGLGASVIANLGCPPSDGIYLSENIETADYYVGFADTGIKTKTKQGKELHTKLYGDSTEHPRNVCYVVVCRVLLGYPIRTRELQLHTDCRACDGKHASETGQVFDTSQGEAQNSAKVLSFIPQRESDVVHSDRIRYHSVVREGRHQRLREFVLFDGDLCYPEYICAYRRTSAPD
uniref:Uncharacterized protein n=1 Tax=uncultured organism MedDCM-OCT-S09-C9 TaxID=743653 RepID=D6PJF4_9ZZZZ|nr:hypothetical protein [uncultured organism MedDCM-OCT-S09-C9]